MKQLCLLILFISDSRAISQPNEKASNYWSIVLQYNFELIICHLYNSSRYTKCPLNYLRYALLFNCNSFTFNTKIEKDYQRRCKYLKQKRAFLRLPNSHLHSHHINIKQNKRYNETHTHLKKKLNFVSNCIINNFYLPQNTKKKPS